MFRSLVIAVALTHSILVSQSPAEPFLGWCKQALSRLIPTVGQPCNTHPSCHFGYWQGFVMVNGIPVTGSETYPARAVLQRLDLNIQDLPRYRGRRVLTVGEGYGNLLDTFVGNGAHAEALDLWYHSQTYPRGYYGNLMREFVEQWGDRLIRGSVFEVPKPNRSVDLYLSHGLVNNLGENAVSRMAAEAFRVLTVGGEARIDGFDLKEAELVQEFLEWQFGPGIEVSSQKISTNWTSHWGYKSSAAYLLIFRKVNP